MEHNPLTFEEYKEPDDFSEIPGPEAAPDPLLQLESERAVLEERFLDPALRAQEAGLSVGEANRLTLGYEAVAVEIRAQADRVMQYARAGMLAATLATAPLPALAEAPQEGTVATIVVDGAASALESSNLSPDMESVSEEDEVLSEPDPSEGGPAWVPMEEHIPTEEELTKEAARQQLSAERERVTAEVEKGFPNREALLAFYADLAEKSAVEYFIIYGEDHQGDLVVLRQAQGEAGTVTLRKRDLATDVSRERGINHVRVLHTHPRRAIEEAMNEEEIAIPEGDLTIPFSVPDFNLAIRQAWHNRYDDAARWQEAMPGSLSSVSEIVDPSGVWTLELDPTNAYVQAVVAAREQSIVGSDLGEQLLKEHPSLTKEELGELVRVYTSPDDLVSSRVVSAVRKHGLTYSDLNMISAQHQLSSLSEDGELYDLSRMQLKVGASAPEDRGKAIEEFIAFFAEKGIAVTYTPHARSGVAQAVTSNPEPEASGRPE